LVHEFLVPVERHIRFSSFEKIAHAQRVAAIELFFGFKGIAEKRKELRTSNLVHEFLVPVESHKNQYTKFLYKSLTEF